MNHIVIIGNGIAGITAARHIRKWSEHRITVISAESEHFFSRTALMYVYMGHMNFEHIKPYENWFWSKNRIELKQAYVKQVDTENKSLQLDSGETLNYDRLIIASGSVSNKFNWPGQNLPSVQGLYSLQDLQLMEQNTQNIQKAVIVGGGLIGIEMAEMLLSRNIPVTFLVRESTFWNNILPEDEARLISAHIREHGVELRLSTELKSIQAGPDNRVGSVITQYGDEVPCQFVGLTVGVSPNISFLNDSGIATNRGVLVNGYLETNIPNVYAIGDCAEFINPLKNRSAIEQVWYTGRMMGETLAHSICKARVKYKPGPWFNSAKFFDIEYQTYGSVSPQPAEGEASFYWQHPRKSIAIRINYLKATGQVIGCNTLGIRMRQDVWDNWISNAANIDRVMADLPQANFDPEFFFRYENEIIDAYNRETGRNIKKRSKKGLLSLFS